MDQGRVIQPVLVSITYFSQFVPGVQIFRQYSSTDSVELTRFMHAWRAFQVEKLKTEEDLCSLSSIIVFRAAIKLFFMGMWWNRFYTKAEDVVYLALEKLHQEGQLFVFNPGTGTFVLEQPGLLETPLFRRPAFGLVLKDPGGEIHVRKLSLE